MHGEIKDATPNHYMFFTKNHNYKPSKELHSDAPKKKNNEK